jgi:hypothetical protein
LTASGLLDPTFSDDGYAPASTDSPVDCIYDIAAQPDGKVVAAILDGTHRVARFIVDEDSDGDGIDDPTESALGTGVIDPDSDDDGLSDGDEVLKFQSSPLDPDSDDDGLQDGAEVNTHHSSPINDDSDGDGLGDYDEVVTHGTNPILSDSDGDGLSDSAEIQTHHTDPLDSDMDNDGLSDGYEINIGTSPIKKDTDGDGFLDAYEVQTGKSPTDPEDKPALVAEARTAIEFSFPTAIGKTYRIEASLDMAEWAPIEENITGTGGAVTRFYTTRNMPKRFLRVEEQAAP